jgi:UDP-glucose 4-epimerase
LKIVLTGASSFTGYWFAHELVHAGHQLILPLRAQGLDGYSEMRRTRVQKLGRLGEVCWGTPFGSERFEALLASGVDLLCHHAARVDDYRSLDFDVLQAVSDNTRNIRRVIGIGHAAGMRGILVTGSVFEPDEGVGQGSLRAFSPYGLSKSFSYQIIRYWAELCGLPCAKFVIPNPFGPYEEPRFCSYLINCWARGNLASVRTPLYIRDNIHVSLLAKAYSVAVAQLDGGRPVSILRPSGYVESQGSFAKRLAREIGSRLGLECRVALEEQIDFSEPMIRFNADPVNCSAVAWDEGMAWDNLAQFYRATFFSSS